MKTPHIIVVLDDQHRYSALGANHNSLVRTPHIDSLATQGLVFDQMFVSAPVCAPYRGQLFTGRYAHKNGVVDNEYKLRSDQQTLAQVLKSTGYRTAYVGKWHLGYPPYTEENRFGFDYMAAQNCEHNYYAISYYENERGPIQINGWAPVHETDLAIRVLETHQREERQKPLFLVLSWGPPHWPYELYPEEYRIYDPHSIELQPNVPERMAAFARGEIADYYGSITALDAQFGRLMAALDRLGFIDESLLIFTSDHGDHLSSHGYSKELDRSAPPELRASKGTPYEESIHVPFIARFPGRIAPGRRTQALMSSVDIMPSVLGLCGLTIPKGVQGCDLSHVFLGKDGPLADSVYLQILGPGWPHRGKWVGFWRGLRTPRWTYARWFQDEYGPLLFDHDRDPFEMRNLAGSPEVADTERLLEARLRRWMADTADPFETGPRDPETGMLELGQEYTNPMYLVPGDYDHV